MLVEVGTYSDRATIADETSPSSSHSPDRTSSTAAVVSNSQNAGSSTDLLRRTPTCPMRGSARDSVCGSADSLYIGKV